MKQSNRGTLSFDSLEETKLFFNLIDENEKQTIEKVLEIINKWHVDANMIEEIKKEFLDE